MDLFPQHRPPSEPAQEQKYIRERYVKSYGKFCCQKKGI